MAKRNNDNKNSTKNEVLYSFIPLSESFYIPTWTVSNDMPCCENPLSGKIQLHIVTRSPMIVRQNGEMENVGGNYFIPATSLKGCIRNVLEIMSFSKLRTQYTKYYEIPELYKNQHDLSEYIFGYVDDKQSLKGRVQFGNVFCINNVGELPSKTVVLGNPFYNSETGKYAEHLYIDKSNDGRKIIKGWKRYPVKKNFVEPDGQPESKTTTTFRAIKENAEFLAEVSYFNLNEIELGALLCALTFNNNAECCHLIGSGKGLGYGKMSIQILNFTTENIAIYIQSFLDALKQEISASDVDLRFDELKKLSVCGNLDEDLIIKLLRGYIEKKENDKSTMWLKRLAVINKKQTDQYRQALSLLYEAEKEKELSNLEIALSKYAAANEILKSQIINDWIAQLKQEIKEITVIGKIEEMETSFKDIKQSACSNDEKKTSFNKLYSSLSNEKKNADIQNESVLNRFNNLETNIETELALIEQANKENISYYIKNANKIKTLSENLKRWKNQKDISLPSEDDLIQIEKKVFDIYNSTKSKDRDKLKSSKEFKELTLIVGEDIFNMWLEKL